MLAREYIITGAKLKLIPKYNKDPDVVFIRKKMKINDNILHNTFNKSATAGFWSAITTEDMSFKINCMLKNVKINITI